jgi:hypothetical protein
MKLCCFNISDDDNVWVAENDGKDNLAVVAALLRNPGKCLEAWKKENEIDDPNLALGGKVVIEFRYGYQDQIVDGKSVRSKKVVVKGEYQKKGEKGASSVVQVDLPGFREFKVTDKLNVQPEFLKLASPGPVEITLLKDSTLSYIHFDVNINPKDARQVYLGSLDPRLQRGIKIDDCYDIFARYYLNPTMFSSFMYAHASRKGPVRNDKEMESNVEVRLVTCQEGKGKVLATKSVEKGKCALGIAPNTMSMTYLYDPSEVGTANSGLGRRDVCVKVGEISHCFKLVAQYNPSMLPAMLSAGTAVAYTGQSYSGLLAPWGGGGV